VSAVRLANVTIAHGHELGVQALVFAVATLHGRIVRSPGGNIEFDIDS
jgi:hypothetical protein